jgi:hypothetical protein
MIRQLGIYLALAFSASLIFPAAAAAQYYPPNGWYRYGPPTGYWVRGSGYYDGSVVPPGYGPLESYHAGRPWVTVADPWGRVADVPLRPKVLYYSDQFVTPYGGFYPTHVVVIPDDRRPPARTYYRPAPASPPAATPKPSVELPRAPIPPAAPPKPATDPASRLGPAPAETPKTVIPPATAPEPRPVSEPPKLPVVPALPRLPDVPSLPGAAPKPAGKAPKLGPAPANSHPAR